MTRLRAPIALALVLVVTACGAGSRPPASPTSSPVLPIVLPACITAADGDPQRVTAADGTTTDGLLMGTGDRGVVLAHQTDVGPCAFIELARSLVSEGYHVALYQQQNELQDIPAWTAALAAAGARQVVLLGASIGAMGALAVAADHAPPVTGVIAFSALRGTGGSSYVADAVSTLTLPVLFVAGRDDPDGAGAAAQSFDATCPSPQKTLLLLDSDVHGIALLDSTDGRRIRAAVDTFLAAHLAG